MPDAAPSYKLSENSSLLLDLVRVLASQAVLVGHGISFFRIYPSLQPPQVPYMQNTAVVVFFVLSGFLITYATLRKPAGFQFREFVIDRFARIYSAYVVVLILVWLIDRYAIHVDAAGYGYGSALDWKTFVANLGMLQDYPIRHPDFAFTSFGSARPFWTIAVEWWIYMLFGWIVLRNRSRSVVLYLTVLAVLSLVPALNIRGRGNGLALMWIFGAVTYLLATTPQIRAVGPRVMAFASLCFGACGILLLRETQEPYDVRFAALLAGMLLCGILALDRVQWKVPAIVAKGIRFVANYSFTLYLLHYTILNLLANHPVFDDPTLDFYLAFVVANVTSIVVAYFTEFRHRELATWLKKRFLAR